MKKEIKNWIFLFLVAFSMVFAWRFYFTQKNKEITGSLYVSGAVVPHHDLVAEARSEFFKKLAGEINQPKTIVLLSPNHYSAGSGKAQVYGQDWNLAEEKISSDKEIISYLIKNNLASYEPGSFKQEHGIYNILQDIKDNFPKAKIVPIILKDISESEIVNLEKGILQVCKDCLAVSSVDFSHYQPDILADLHDQKSIRSLQNLDTIDLLQNVEVDSGPALAFLSLWAKDHNTLQFVLKNHTITPGTTHVFGFYQEGKKTNPEKQASFIFAGDAMFARGIDYKFGKDFNQVFTKFGDRVFWGTDASILNFEGAITKNKIEFKPNTMNFQFKPEVVKTLNYLHVNGVSLANNHSDNAGKEGYKITQKILTENNIKSFGAAEFKGQGINVVVIGVNLTYPGQSAEPVVAVIKKYKENSQNRVVVMAHWGDEYFEKHNKFQQDSAHLWIDAGADLVVGSHPHVIQDTELYKNVPIFYSLGNFLFDQDFSKATQQGILLAGKFTEKGISLFALPTQSINYQPQLMTGSAKQKILDSLYEPFKNYDIIIK